MLDNIENAINEGQNLEIKAFDQDVGSSDFLGAANPISFTSLVEDEEEHTLDRPLFNDCKQVGNIKFSTKLLWA